MVWHATGLVLLDEQNTVPVFERYKLSIGVASACLPKSLMLYSLVQILFYETHTGGFPLPHVVLMVGLVILGQNNV